MESDKVYRVEYAFEAEDSAELSVAQGELVVTLAREEGADESDGWAMVETTSEPRRAGFVPTDYLVPIAQAAATQETPGSADAGGAANASEFEPQEPAMLPETGPAHEHSDSPAFHAAGSRATNAGLGQPSVGESSRYPPAPAPAPAHAPEPYHSPHSPAGASASAASPGMASSALSAYSRNDVLALDPASAGAGEDPLISAAAATAAMKSEEFAHLFEAHDQWFRQALNRRQETFKALTGSVTELNRRLVDGESKATSLAERMAKLEGIVESERQRWTEQLEKERAAIGEAPTLID